MHPLPSWRLGHLILSVEQATLKNWGDSWSFEVRAGEVEYLNGRSPSFSGVVDLATNPADHIGQKVDITVKDSDDLALYTGIHSRPKSLSATVMQVENEATLARIEGLVDVEWDELLGNDVPFVLEGWFLRGAAPAWWPTNRGDSPDAAGPGERGRQPPRFRTDLRPQSFDCQYPRERPRK